MPKLRKDSYGFVVQINGGYYRPEKSVDDYPLAPGVRTFVSSFKEGEQVNVKNMLRTPFCKVTNNNLVEEVWVFHGPVSYMSGLVPNKRIKYLSDEAWNPS